MLSGGLCSIASHGSSRYENLRRRLWLGVLATPGGQRTAGRGCWISVTGDTWARFYKLTTFLFPSCRHPGVPLILCLFFWFPSYGRINLCVSGFCHGWRSQAVTGFGNWRMFGKDSLKTSIIISLLMFLGYFSPCSLQIHHQTVATACNSV